MWVDCFMVVKDKYVGYFIFFYFVGRENIELLGS